MYAIDQEMPRNCDSCPFMAKRELLPKGPLEIRSRFCLALDEYIPVTNNDFNGEKEHTRPRFCPLVQLNEQEYASYADEDEYYDDYADEPEE